MISANDERLQRILMGQERLMQEVHAILEEEQRKDDIVSAVVLSSKKAAVNRIARLDPDRVFHVDSIRALCIRFRLRFLDAGHYKGALPPRALYELRQLEARAEGHLRGFKVMAPADRFRLCDSDADPMLFVPVGSDHYYLVHKWGRDLHWSRPLLTWPKRGPLQLALFVMVIALAVACSLPGSLVNGANHVAWLSAGRLALMFYCVMMCAGCTAFGWFAFGGTFSAQVWRSKTRD